MWFKKKKPDKPSEDKAEEHSPITEMDNAVEPLIKKVTKMALKQSVLGSLVVLTVVLTPAAGIVAQPMGSEDLSQEEQYSPVVLKSDVESEETSEELPWYKKAAAGAVKSGKYVVGGVSNIYEGITNDEEKEKRMAAQIKALERMLIQKQAELDAYAVKARIDHTSMLHCSKKVTLYLESLEIPEQ